MGASGGPRDDVQEIAALIDQHYFDAQRATAIAGDLNRDAAAGGFDRFADRNDLVEGEVQGKKLLQYDLTPQQYDSLIKLTATLCKVFPKITCDYPRGEDGKLITRKLDAEALANYHGVMGHYHIQTNKIDPGPALQWDRLIEGAQGLR